MEGIKNSVKSFFHKIIDFFLQGLLYTVPLGLTVFFIYKLFWFIDEMVQQYLLDIMPVKVPGLGLIILFAVISLMGVFGQSILSRPINAVVNKLLGKAPLIKLVYTAIRDFLSAFLSKDKKFNQPVLVKVNHISNLEKLGFITQDDLSFLNLKGKVAVYFPHSYNFSGEMFIVPAENVTPVDMSPTEAMKFIVSGGVAK
jgi:uncharacterized membrane protein